MADVDVKVGLQVTGDASGAQAVDDALKKVAETAKTVNDSAGKGVGEVSGNIGELDKALKSLSPEKAKNLVGGLAQALVGLGSGEVTTSLSGLSRHLTGLAGLIPFSGVATLLAGSAGAIAAVYKLLGEDAEAAKRPVTEFGLSVDEEMSRLEEWSKAEIRWSSILAANDALRTDFASVKSSADSTLAAIEAVYKVQSSATLSKLQGDLATAQASGDADAAGRIQAEIDIEKAVQPLVELNNKVAALESDYAAAVSMNSQIEANGKKAADELAAARARLESLEAEVKRRTGNTDAVYHAGSREKLSEDLSKDIKGKAAYASFLAAYEQGLPRATDFGPEGREIIQQKYDELVRVEDLLTQLAGADALVESVTKAEKDLADQRAKNDAEAQRIYAEMVKTGLALKTAEMQRDSASAAAGPEASSRASAKSEAIKNALADMLESSLNLTSENADQIKKAAETSVQSAIDSVKSGEQLVSDYRAAIERMWVAADSGQDIAPFESEVNRIYAAISQIGQAASVSSPGEVLESIATSLERGEQRLRGAGEVVKQGADQIGAKAEATAAEFGSDISTAGKTLDAAGKKLLSFISAFSGIVDSMAASVERSSQMAEAALRKANAAASDSSLALSQIRNSSK